MKCEDFVKVAEETLDSLPEEFRIRIRNVSILVEDFPPNQSPPQPGQQRRLLLGIFQGVPATMKSVFDLPIGPAHIVLYQKNIEAVCSSEAEVRQQIRQTLMHELGHYFGMTEEQLKGCLGFFLIHVEVSKRDLMEPNTLTRLKRVAGKQTTTLTHYGRKTGKPHEVTIWFVLDDDKLYISTANVNRQWVRNVQKTLKITLSIAGDTFEGNARFLTDRAQHARAMAAIRRKYWMYSPIMALGRVLTTMGLMRDNTGSFEVTLSGS